MPNWQGRQGFDGVVGLAVALIMIIQAVDHRRGLVAIECLGEVTHDFRVPIDLLAVIQVTRTPITKAQPCRGKQVVVVECIGHGSKANCGWKNFRQTYGRFNLVKRNDLPQSQSKRRCPPLGN